MERNDFFKIDLPKHQEKAYAGDERPKRRFRRATTLQGIVTWIDGQEYSQEVKDGLVKIASTYPHSALDFFRKNINRHIAGLVKKKN